jgi:hypothetical protein
LGVKVWLSGENLSCSPLKAAKTNEEHGRERTRPDSKQVHKLENLMLGLLSLEEIFIDGRALVNYCDGGVHGWRIARPKSFRVRFLGRTNESPTMLSSALRARVVLRVVRGPHLRRSEVSRKSLRAASRSRNFSVSLSRYQDQPKDVYQKEQVGNAQLENEQGETQKKPPAISDFDIFSGSQGAANLISAYNDVAFIINESTVYGSVALWEDLYMKWSPERPEDITPASLAWITLKYPVTSTHTMTSGAWL